MSILTDRFGDCATQSRGSGLGDCLKKYGDVVGIDVIKKRWSLDLETDTLDEATYKGLIQDLTVRPFNDVFNFEQSTPDTERSTSNRGLLSDIRKGKPQYSFMFDDGYCAQKNLYSLDGSSVDIALKFETGIFFATNVDETEIKGFDNGLFSVSTFKFQQGTDPEMSSVMIQFNNAIELNTRGVFLTWESRGFDGNLENGVINTEVSYNTAPTATDTVEVKVLDDCNKSVSVLGLEPTDFDLGGTQTTATTITAAAYNSGGYYVLTLDNPLVATDTVQPSVRESGKQSAANASGDLYMGTAPLATIS